VLDKDDAERACSKPRSLQQKRNLYFDTLQEQDPALTAEAFCVLHTLGRFVHRDENYLDKLVTEVDQLRCWHREERSCNGTHFIYFERITENLVDAEPCRSCR